MLLNYQSTKNLKAELTYKYLFIQLAKIGNIISLRLVKGGKWPSCTLSALLVHYSYNF